MTHTAEPTTLAFEDVTFDAYAIIHKTLRSVLFSTVVEVGIADPASLPARHSVHSKVPEVLGLLAEHAGHEDEHVQPVLRRELEELAERVATEHDRLEQQATLVRELSSDAYQSTRPRRTLHKLYIELAAFTSDYMRHQDFEERVVMPAMEQAIGVPGVIAIHEAIGSGMSARERTTGLGLMLPATNIDERVELLNDIRRGAPTDAFAGICALAASVLTDADYRQLTTRLGLV